MNNQIRIIILWLILVICMILHFDYHVSDIFYGIDVKRPDADGTVPFSIIYIRAAFHFLPLLFVVLLLSKANTAIKFINLILSVAYTLSHAAHLVGELRKGDNPSQMTLLGVTLYIAVMLVIYSWMWRKENPAAAYK